jgi:8-oxo-dGTP diphosphatase
MLQRPLPRLLALTDARIAGLEDLGVRAAAIAAAGPAAALVARLPGGRIDALACLAQRFAALAAPPMATVLVTGRCDVACGTGAHGVILRHNDLDPATARSLLPAGSPIFASVHGVNEAQAAIDAGVDALIVGTIWASASHPGNGAAGIELLGEVVGLGRPVYAVGGVTPARAQMARDAGAWGVAAISAVWDAADRYRAARELIRSVTT